MITHRTAKLLMWNILTRRVVNGAKLVGLCSRGEGESLGQLGLKIPQMVIPNGFRIPTDFDVDEEPKIDGPYILFLGFLDPRKRPDSLIKSFSKSEARHTHRLILVGPDGYGYKTQLESLAVALGLGSRTVFYGPAYGAEKWNIIKNATCLCLPSKGEGMPLVVLEALGTSTPTIFSSACNLSDIADEGRELNSTAIHHSSGRQQSID